MKKLYIPVYVKFIISLLGAVAWCSLALYLSQPWYVDLSLLTSKLVAGIIIAFLAIIPGFFFSFILISFLLDHRPPLRPLKHYPTVVVFIPIFNEAESIKDTLLSIKRQQYPGKINIIVINDGSTDNSVEIIQQLNLDNLTLLDSNHQGKATALNLALKHSRESHIITIDGDTFLDKNAICCIVEKLHSSPPSTAAVAGSVYVRNSRENWLTQMQEWDYFNNIAAIKRIQSLFQGTLVAQGAFSIFYRDPLLEVNGWPNSVGEDILLTWEMLNKGHLVNFSEDAICFTTVPNTYRKFFMQRARWAYGMVEGLYSIPNSMFHRKITSMFIWWNMLFPLVDSVYFFVFIPGIILALLGQFYIVGPMTLTLVPLALLANLNFFKVQRKVFGKHNFKVRHNIFGFLTYVLFYNIIHVPASMYGYFIKPFISKRSWGTKKFQKPHK